MYSHLKPPLCGITCSGGGESLNRQSHARVLVPLLHTKVAFSWTLFALCAAARVIMHNNVFEFISHSRISFYFDLSVNVCNTLFNVGTKFVPGTLATMHRNVIRDESVKRGVNRNCCWYWLVAFDDGETFGSC